ncbi:MAG: peptidase U34 [Chloroflexota bacterium]|nr:MAG: peptidase U34 [Chloroflexota bacterium]
MCDTLVALGNATSDGSVIFAKNSDREPNEAHELVLIPAEAHPEGSEVQCTYIRVPQVAQTHAVLLAKPFWIWGAEMGANEHGVVIGNEAVFTRVPYDKGPGLTGMDLLRLALERAATARLAMDVIVSLLEKFGQGGSCGFTHPFYYHNSFILADLNEAWVLETAGRQWAAEKVKDIRSISNAITIGEQWEMASDGLVDYALERGWCKRREDFDFGRCYSDPLYTRLGAAHFRQGRTTQLMNACKVRQGEVTVKAMMDSLRDHGPDAAPNQTIRQGLTGADVCMHAAFGPVRNSQTTGSIVSRLAKDSQTHWLTGTAAPCTGIFKPVWIDAGLPDLGPQPTGQYDQAALWWRHEALHRAVLCDYGKRIEIFRQERDALENTFLQSADQAANLPASERAALTARCFDQAEAALECWTENVGSCAGRDRNRLFYRMAWRGFNRQGKLPQ